MPSPIPERAPLLAPSALAFHNGLPDSQFSPADRIDSETKTSTRIKIGSAMFSFIILGLFTSSIGVMLPPLSTYYNLSDVHVSLIFLFVPFGYIIGASSNSLVHHHFGQRGIAVLGPALHMISAVALGLHPPFSILLAFFSVNALGSGMLDGSWCAFAAGMKNAGFVSGLLHGSFSVGAALGPFCAGALMEKGMNWWVWYYALVSPAFYTHWYQPFLH
jgi:fucose permease